MCRMPNGYTKEKWNVCVTRSREKACCSTEPGGDERVTPGGAVQALFAVRQGGVEQQVSVGQHSQHRSLWTLGYLRTSMRIKPITLTASVCFAHSPDLRKIWSAPLHLGQNVDFCSFRMDFFFVFEKEFSTKRGSFLRRIPSIGSRTDNWCATELTRNLLRTDTQWSPVFTDLLCNPAQMFDLHSRLHELHFILYFW